MNPVSLRLLCADDNDLDVERVERLAERLGEAVEIRHARDGVDALEQLARSDDDALPHAILLDLNMPRLDGHGCLEAIRGNSRYRHLFIALVTTSMRESDQQRAVELGADAYLVKALNRDNFATTLNAIRERSACA